jgi:hypothetical protein
MRTLKRIWVAFCQLAKPVWLLPRAIAKGFEQRRRQAVLDGDEAERLDRIRNPSKYLGK